MDDAARRVSPSPLWALMRLRERREESALRELRAGQQLCAQAGQARLEAQDAVVRHEARRAAREAGLLDKMRDTLQTADKILLARDQLERLAEQALRLEQENDDAAAALRDAETKLQRARLHHAACVRRRTKWQRTLERVLSAHADHSAVVEESELEEEAASRHRPPPDLSPDLPIGGSS